MYPLLLLAFSMPAILEGRPAILDAQILADIQKVRATVFNDFQGMYRKPEGALLFPYVTPGTAAYSTQLWDWDSWLVSVALLQIQREGAGGQTKEEAEQFASGCVLNFLEFVRHDGFLPIVITKDTKKEKFGPSGENMHKPVLAQQAAFLVQQRGGNVDWLRDRFSHLQKFVNNYRFHHRHAPTGLYFWQNDHGIGVDNDPATFFRPPGSSASILLNCLMYRELLAMEYLAEKLDQSAVSKEYRDAAIELKTAIQQHCWDERDGFFYSVDLNLLPREETSPDGKGFRWHAGAPRDWDCLIQRIGVWSGFMAIWADIATPEQAARMVQEHFNNEKTFSASYGVRTLSKQEKMYSVRASSNPSNWLGPVWGCSNYFVWRGLVRYGYADEARSLATKTVRLFARDFERNGALHEYYDPDSGEPIMNKGFQNWNYLVINMAAWLEGADLVAEF